MCACVHARMHGCVSLCRPNVGEYVCVYEKKAEDSTFQCFWAVAVFLLALVVTACSCGGVEISVYNAWAGV